MRRTYRKEGAKYEVVAADERVVVEVATWACVVVAEESRKGVEEDETRVNTAVEGEEGGK